MRYTAIIKSEIIPMVADILSSTDEENAIKEAVKLYGKNHPELKVVDELNNVVYCHHKAKKAKK